MQKIEGLDIVREKTISIKESGPTGTLTGFTITVRRNYGMVEVLRQKIQ